MRLSFPAAIFVRVFLLFCFNDVVDGDEDADQRVLLRSAAPPGVEEDTTAELQTKPSRIRQVIVNQIAVAEHGYAATKESVFNLAVGEGVLVLEYRGDGDIYQVKNRNGVVGLVPESVLSQPTSLFEYPWYHGRVSREESERILKGRTDGSYLVRDGQNDNYPHTLTVCCDDKVEHYRIHRSVATGMIFIADDERFYTLPELIWHHSSDPDGLLVALMYPVPRRGSNARSQSASNVADAFGREKMQTSVGSSHQADDGRNVS